MLDTVRARTPAFSQFCCPTCRHSVQERDGALVCDACGTRYPVQDGVVRFILADSSHGELSPQEMREMLALAEATGWQKALSEYAAPRRGNIVPLVTDPRRGRVADALRAGADARVLDLGCGYGGVAIQLARRFREVVGLDGSLERVSFLGVIRRQEGLENITPVVHNDILHLPFPDGCFDAVSMIGVLEYLPQNLPQDSIAAAHQRCLREVHRVLRPGGELLVGSKNRFALHYLRGGRDHNGLPFGPALPLWLADLLLRATAGKRYRIVNYSVQGYRRLLQSAGFFEIRTFWPVGGYQFPDRLIPIEPGKRMLTAEMLESMPASKRTRWAWLDRLHLLGNVVDHVVAAARKPQ